MDLKTIDSISDIDYDYLNEVIGFYEESLKYKNIPVVDKLDIKQVIDAAKEKLLNKKTVFSPNECQVIIDALINNRSIINKEKANARKGTANYKRIHKSLSRINKLISEFS
ncbi:hypothetical protein [Anaerovorax odorimutans]|uniref:hypothetical protein n=1 Tax=Anaerovorax odorimutans TaxID=109327 RepID=UPI00042002B1|nr:hypothetical protein [Anaerovorax odorimutans]